MSVATRAEAVRLAQKCVDGLPLEEKVVGVSVWEFSLNVGGGWGWSVRSSKGYGDDKAYDMSGEYAQDAERRNRDARVVNILNGERNA
jgi:hypothetical protein